MYPQVTYPDVDTGPFAFGAALAASSVKDDMPKLYDKQAEVKRDLARFNVLNCGRRWGKNVFEHDFTVDGLLHGLPVGWGSPTYKNLTEDWRTLSEVLAPITKRKHEQERRIECVTGGGRFVINEAAQVRYLLNTWNKIIRPTLTDLKGDGLFGSTPDGLNDFHTIYNWGLGSVEGWRSWHFTSYENPYLDAAELDSLRDTMSDREFRQEIMAEFIQNEGAVFRNLEAALMAPYEEPDDHKDHVIVAGGDWGKLGDFTALSVGCATCKRELALDRFNQIDYYFQRQRLESMHTRWTVKRWDLELNSIGEPNFESLQRAGLPVVGFKTTHVSKQPLIEAFSLALERGDLMLLPDDVGRSELQAYEVKRTQTGTSVYSAPEGMHDDTVIARALMYRAMQNTPAEPQTTDPEVLEAYRNFHKALNSR